MTSKFYRLLLARSLALVKALRRAGTNADLLGDQGLLRLTPLNPKPPGRAPRAEAF